MSGFCWLLAQDLNSLILCKVYNCQLLQSIDGYIQVRQWYLSPLESQAWRIKKIPPGGSNLCKHQSLMGPLIHKNWSPESHWRALYTAWGWSLAGLRHLKHSQSTNCLTPGITRVSEGLVRHGWRNTEKSQQTKSKKMFTPCIVKVFPDPVWPYANKQPLYPWETAETCLSNVKLRNFRLSQAPSRTLWSNGLAVRSLEKLHI